MFPLLPRGDKSNIMEKSSQLALEHEFLIRSRVKDPFLKLTYTNRQLPCGKNLSVA